MKHQKSCGPCLGKLVHQLPRVVTFAYILCFRRMIAHWKGIFEEIHFGGNIEGISIFLTIFPKKIILGNQNGSRSEKLLKIVNCQNCKKIVFSELEKVSGHRDPPRSLYVIDCTPRVNCSFYMIKPKNHWG